MKIGLVGAVSVVALGVACGASAAMAQSVSPDMFFAHPYVAFGAGFNSSGVSIGDVLSTNTFFDWNPVTVTSKNLDLGGAFSAALGVEPMPGVRTEIEASYHRNTGAHFDAAGEGNGSLGVDASTFLLMANVWKDFGLSDGFSVHLGGGLGFGTSTLDLHDEVAGTTSSLSHTGLALQAGVGFDYALMNSMILTADYRVSGITGGFGANSFTSDTTFSGETFTGQLTKSVDQTFTVGLRIPFTP